jgi:enoyl-CoA hydratase
MILLGRAVRAEEALRMGLANALVPRGKAIEKALAWAEMIASFPQETMLADREAALRGSGLALAEGLRLEAKLGFPTVGVALRGAARFAAGEGRGGRGVPT